ncbi:LPS translocon maturation chaperone LptM [Marinobacterium zhoushanense]|nr:lipoprotein [Marinobacterium zhoushanense]
MKRCWPILILGTLLLVGCGQKGPLSLPQTADTEQQAQ